MRRQEGFVCKAHRLVCHSRLKSKKEDERGGELTPHATQVPWGDLRYIFGDIMYGGHITDPYDRILCR